MVEGVKMISDNFFLGTSNWSRPSKRMTNVDIAIRKNDLENDVGVCIYGPYGILTGLNGRGGGADG